MEDIAEIYAKMGEIELAVFWLQKALKGARSLWGEWVATAHIRDKLDNAFRQMGVMRFAQGE